MESSQWTNMQYTVLQIIMQVILKSGRLLLERNSVLMCVFFNQTLFVWIYQAFLNLYHKPQLYKCVTLSWKSYSASDTGKKRDLSKEEQRNAAWQPNNKKDRSKRVRMGKMSIKNPTWKIIWHAVDKSHLSPTFLSGSSRKSRCAFLNTSAAFPPFSLLPFTCLLLLSSLCYRWSPKQQQQTRSLKSIHPSIIYLYSFPLKDRMVWWTCFCWKKPERACKLMQTMEAHDIWHMTYEVKCFINKQSVIINCWHCALLFNPNILQREHSSWCSRLKIPNKKKRSCTFVLILCCKTCSENHF